MTDLSTTIIPKSDQMNADDLISGPKTIVITKVSANPSSSEQPISIYYEGDGGKPYKPCKSMRRVMVAIWGKDGGEYPGRGMTLYRDQSVTWGGLAVGGIRISHMSHMDKPVTMALTATKQSRKPFTVNPLDLSAPKVDPIDAYAKEVGAAIKQMSSSDLYDWWSQTKERRDALEIPADRLAKMDAAVAAKMEKEG